MTASPRRCFSNLCPHRIPQCLRCGAFLRQAAARAAKKRGLSEGVQVSFGMECPNCGARLDVSAMLRLDIDVREAAVSGVERVIRRKEMTDDD